MKKIQIEDICFTEKKFDFTSSGQGINTDKQVLWKETLLINMANAYSLNEYEHIFQAIVCEQCGITNCVQGNWVAIRKIGDRIFFIPAFEWIIEENRGLKEYFPPKYLAEVGAIEIEKDAFDYLQLNIPAFARIKKFKPISGFELSQLIRYEVPITIRGKLGTEIALSTNNLLATNCGELKEIIKQIEYQLNKIRNGNIFELNPIEKEEEEVILFLDDYKTSEWNIGIKKGTEVQIRIGNYAIKTGANTLK